MEIRPVAVPAAVPSAQGNQPTRPPRQAQTPAELATAVQAEAPVTEEVRTAERAERPRVAKVRTELLFDDTIKRVVGRIFDPETGKTLREIPPEELRQLYAKTREQLASLFNETA